jgi:hypothetical protein
MNRAISTLAFAALIAAGACGRSNDRAADSALNTDLSLAAQQRGAQPLDTLSPAERARLDANALNGTATAVAPAPVSPVRRTSSGGEVSRPRRSSSSGSSSGSVSSSGSTARTTTSSGTVVKHTQRDAAIGAAAGAIIGATTSHSKVKGGLIGAAVGGILGGVIGNNVDKKKKP